MTVKITVADRHLKEFQTALRAIGDGAARPVMARALNRVGDMANTRVKRLLSSSMGVKNLKIHKAVVTKKANKDSLIYEITGTGRHFSLIDSKGVKVASRMVPRADGKFGGQTRAQFVTAGAWGVSEQYDGAFIARGQAGQTKGAGAGHIFARTSDARHPIRKLWGPAIPREMVRKRTETIVEDMVDTVLTRRLEHELGRLLKV
ncbi:phage tail protein [Camelimonas lactis]|uniref:Minor tail protein Z (GPZ) n=1 Tax=Camelimonas lactis TaxID=659006 RepID=A0A4R2GGV0_9HYPH|nr:phage tail protein [Camelimonas lactis]TCO07555.1 minor tail protein Z (GPZ) [Camelimonas lactis]